MSDELQQIINDLVHKHGAMTVMSCINTLSPSDLKEPVLDPNNHKFTAFPITYNSIWNEYKKQMANMWTAEEIDLSHDYDDFLKLDKDEQHFIEMILAFFAASDGIVNFNLGERFIREIKITEALFAYQFQMMMENVHSHVYSLMLDNIVKDPVRRHSLFNAIDTIPSVKLMADWAFKWIDSSESFAHRLVAFAIVEGVFFSGAFASIFWLKLHKSDLAQKGKPFMNGLVTSNKFISRDEGLHCSFACELYKLLINKLTKNDIYAIMKDAVVISKQFMSDALPVRLIGMNKHLMCDYIEYIADRLLSMLGYDKLYRKANPFRFMDTIGLDDKANFFELRPHSYQDPHVMNKHAECHTVIISDSF